jgi:hypothetical protein
VRAEYFDGRAVERDAAHPMHVRGTESLLSGIVAGLQLPDGLANLVRSALPRSTSTSATGASSPRPGRDPSAKCGAHVLRNIEFHAALDVPFTGEPVSLTLAFANRDDSPGPPTQRQRPIRAIPHKQQQTDPWEFGRCSMSGNSQFACAGIISDPSRPGPVRQHDNRPMTGKEPRLYPPHHEHQSNTTSTSREKD